MGVIDRGDLRARLVGFDEQAVELARIRLVKIVAGIDVRQTTQLDQIAIPAEDDTTTLSRHLGTGVRDDFFPHDRWKPKTRLRRGHPAAKPPAIAGMIPTSSPFETGVLTP